MFTPIHRELGIPPGELTLGILQQAVDSRVEETADLDWKRSIYDRRKPGWDYEAAKDIAAMANSGGGWIFFGVEEDQENSAAARLYPVQWNSDIQQRIFRVSYAKIGPPVLGIQFFTIAINDAENEGCVVAMRVPDSRDAPHFAKKGDDAFVAPRRNGPHTVPMSDREIERGFRERFQYADDKERLLQDRFERACIALRPEDGVFLAMAAVPIELVSKRESASLNDVYEFMGRPLLPELLRKQADSWWNIGEVKKGMRQWVMRNRSSSSHGFRKFLYDDGTVLGAYQLGSLVSGEGANSYYPVGLSNHCMSIHVEIAVIDFITALRKYAEERTANGGFRIRAGLVGMSNEPIYIRTTEGMTNLLLDVEYVEPIVRFQPVTTEVDPLSSPAEMLPTVNDLARDLINQGGVQYLQVIADPND